MAGGGGDPSADIMGLVELALNSREDGRVEGIVVCRRQNRLFEGRLEGGLHSVGGCFLSERLIRFQVGGGGRIPSKRSWDQESRILCDRRIVVSVEILGGGVRVSSTLAPVVKCVCNT